jgi:hypothetical protein
MSVRAILSRVRRLETGPRFGGGECPRRLVTVEVEPGEPVPPDALCCPVCGEPHVQAVIEEIVTEPPAAGG